MFPNIFSYLRFNSHFPGESELASVSSLFLLNVFGESGKWLIYWANDLVVSQPTALRHWRKPYVCCGYVDLIMVQR